MPIHRSLRLERRHLGLKQYARVGNDDADASASTKRRGVIGGRQRATSLGDDGSSEAEKPVRSELNVDALHRRSLRIDAQRRSDHEHDDESARHALILSRQHVREF